MREVETMRYKAKEIKLVVLRLTNDCNLRCLYCYASGGDNKEVMPWSVAKRAIDYAAGKSKSFKIQFTGGEPLLQFDLIKSIIKYVKGRKLNVLFQLQTNGTLIDATMARELKDNKLALGVSLDGMPAINDKLRPFADGKGSTAATIRGLQHLKAEGIKVGLTAVLSNKNILQLPELVELASYLGNIYGISLDLFRPMGRGENNQVSPPDPNLLTEQILKTLHRAEELARLGGSPVRFREIERLKYQIKKSIKREDYCYATTGESLAVTPRGEVYPCSSLADIPEFYMGNIMEKNFSVEDGFKCISFLNSNNIKPSNCLSCPDNWLCGGGCLARRYAYTGSLDRVYWGDCKLKKVLINYVKKGWILCKKSLKG